MGAAVMHWEINTKNAAKVREFYLGLFGWQIQDVPTMNYGLVDTGLKMGINGGIGQVQAEESSYVTFYVQVEDPQTYLDKAVALGGKVILPVTELPDMVTMAMFADPDGNKVGIIKGSQSLPKETKSPSKRKGRAKAKKSPAKRGKTVPRKKKTARKK